MLGERGEGDGQRLAWRRRGHRAQGKRLAAYFRRKRMLLATVLELLATRMWRNATRSSPHSLALDVALMVAALWAQGTSRVTAHHWAASVRRRDTPWAVVHEGKLAEAAAGGDARHPLSVHLHVEGAVLDHVKHVALAPCTGHAPVSRLCRRHSAHTP